MKFEDMSLNEAREHLAKGGALVAKSGPNYFEVREDRAFPEEPETYCLLAMRSGMRGFAAVAGFENLPGLMATHARLEFWEAADPAGAGESGP